MASEKVAVKPKDLQLSDIVIDVCFHPSKDVIAAGTIEGEVSLFSLASENNELMKFVAHKKACRALRFSPSGDELHSASKNRSIVSIDLNSGSIKRKLKKAHESPIYSLVVTGENFLASGDDDGVLKVWDLRMQNAVMEMKENEDFISDMAVDKNSRTLLSTSGDGTLTAFNLRGKKLELQSELFDSEFLSLAIIKGGEKVVCGCGEGELNIFNWGQWGNISDRFPGHPMSVDCIVPITDDIICTGSCDGKIRAVNILPNRFLGVVGEHEDDFPVENLSVSRDKKLLASCSHDQCVKFWNIEDVEKEKIDTSKKAKKSSKQKYLKSAAKDNFFADLEEPSSSGLNANDDDDDHSDHDDDSDEDSD